jgi:hypothetical protein
VSGVRLQRRALAAAGLLATALCVADAVFGVCVGLAHLAPFFVVLAPLLLGRYPGERRLAAALVARSLPRPVRSAPVPAPRGRRVAVPRGGALIAHALATRPPPGLALIR